MLRQIPYLIPFPHFFSTIIVLHEWGTYSEWLVIYKKNKKNIWKFLLRVYCGLQAISKSKETRKRKCSQFMCPCIVSFDTTSSLAKGRTFITDITQMPRWIPNLTLVSNMYILCGVWNFLLHVIKILKKKKWNFNTLRYWVSDLSRVYIDSIRSPHYE